MGHIKEPKNIDFIIQSEPLTKEDREVISEFIKKDKQTLAKKTSEQKLIPKTKEFIR